MTTTVSGYTISARETNALVMAIKGSGVRVRSYYVGDNGNVIYTMECDDEQYTKFHELRNTWMLNITENNNKPSLWKLLKRKFKGIYG